MLNFIKKLFAKEETQEEKIELDKLSNWLDERIKPTFGYLNDNINQIITKINSEKEKSTENLKVLENAQLQNPKIPERVKTIMEGNRAAFIKKVSFFFSNINLKYNDYNELINKCGNVKNEIDSLGKSTARSYQVLNEFFAREAENIAINIKKVEDYSKDIKDSINSSKISNIEKIKSSITDIQNKIKLKEKYSIELENNKKDFQDSKNKKLEIENKINKLKSSEDYKIYENLLVEQNNFESKLSEIENKLFHDFSALEKALKKYAKIAFENENLILEYLNSPIKALMPDNDLKIIKILNDLEQNIISDKLELDPKKSEKTLLKIKELNNEYFTAIQNNFKALNKKLDERKLLIENNEPKKELESNNKELKIINENIEKINNGISNLNNELEKINIEKLKENLQAEVSNLTNARITIH